MRVFATSSGVVAAAAMAPAADPHSADFAAGVTSPVSNADDFLKNSHSGNCISEKGISRRSVVPNPRYSPATNPSF